MKSKMLTQKLINGDIYHPTNKIISVAPKTADPMHFWIPCSKNFESPHLIRCSRVEFINNHLMFYLGKNLIFKVWLKEWKKFKNINQILEAYKIEIC